ncbi:hypothetical protein Q4566_00950 [Tamlana sp. 2_MG-2023]|uniref:hypothetical protein n=1 Tax=unclassified Tamlana TaxID=2614803 RepID=UPI0026E2BCE9|nr:MULTISPECIES: hypothetical protein [unclassified Tamlana]MDO6758751.1 hypothetical protein [Tamlana sp. 2_MG-2023]MDO6789450.1 hypothetical protein [Tamlana sp. 1_MG-2023]
MIKYVFCINTGRSGSHYLANILNCCNNVRAYHEPHPVMNGKPMFEYLKGNKNLLLTLLHEKIEVIQESVNYGEVYFETNHAFIKGFAWEIVNRVPHSEIGVIYLKRNLDDIVKSFHRIDTTPLNFNGKNWMYTPLMEKPETSLSLIFKLEYRVLFFLNRLFKSKYNKKIFKFGKPKYFIEKEINYLKWYVKESDLQARKFKNKYPKIKYFELENDNLNVIETYKTMFEFFNITFSPQEGFYSRVGVTTNLKAN